MDLLLDSALDIGIAERDFWAMTLGEVYRAIESWNRVYKREQREKATYDYIHANLIRHGVGIVLGSKQPMPSLEDVYSELFAEDRERKAEEIQQQKMNLSALRFKQFAESFNQNFQTEVANKINE